MQKMRERQGQAFSEMETKLMFQQILSSLHYIHSNNILHRDIKLDNILIEKNMKIKLIDFGISRAVQKGQRMNE